VVRGFQMLKPCWMSTAWGLPRSILVWNYQPFLDNSSKD